MSNIDKQAVQAVADLKAGYTLGHADVEIIQQMALDAVTLLDELEAKDHRIAELEAREVKLPELCVGVVQGGHAVMVPYAAGHWFNKTAILEMLADAGINIAAAGKGE
ncbi:hypothetical protein [Enterobacter hormaechei]|uniref:hypothetical protein n=1 Tax=Enterobacter hormaechei TaxID=158836 RepID=UPI002FF957E8